MPGGRPSKFTPEVRERILQAVSVGTPLEIACQGAGISYATFRVWMRRGERQKSGVYGDFVRSVLEAKARRLTKWMALIDKAAADGDWKAAAWKAQMCHPEFFGSHHKVELTGKDGGPLVGEVKHESKRVSDPQKQAAILKILFDAGAIDPSGLVPNSPNKKEESSHDTDPTAPPN